MNYNEFKAKYAKGINLIIENEDTLIECGGNDWMDLLCEIWDNKDPYSEEPTEEEMSRVPFLEMYLTDECGIELC
jgi:hypothetical protein